MKLKRTVCLLLAALLAASVSGCAKKPPVYEDFQDSYVDELPENAEDGLTLHAFNWTYREITENLDSIRHAGFKNVLTMPVQQPKSGGSSWWAFYQPLGFSIGDKSALGTKEELIELCAEAEKRGICILADIVVNHLATTDDEEKEPDGTPMVSPAVAEYEPRIYANRNEDTDGTGVTFHHNTNAAGSGRDTQYYEYGNLPDLNTSNAYVQKRVLELLKECIDAGVDGFRFDAAKHIETSADPDYPSDFWENTLGEAKKYYREKTGKELYAYGEILNGPTARSLQNYTSLMRITDDGFGGQLRPALASKDPSKILNASLKTDNASELIAWVESHDEYVKAESHYSDVRVAKYWSIIAVKKDLGGLFLARPTAELTVGVIGSYAFESEYVAVSNRFHNRFYAADSYESVTETYYVVEKIAAGDQGALIFNAGDTDPEKTVKVTVPHLENGNYYDALTGRKIVVHEHTAYVQFEANGMAFLTRSKDIYPQLDISERSSSFVGDKEITLGARNADEAYYYFNGNASEKHVFEKTAAVSLKGQTVDGEARLTVVLRSGKNTLEKNFVYRELQLIDGYFNVVGIPEKYLSGDYDIWLWSWSPGRWSQNYEIRDGVLLVDTKGMTGFLVAVFEKGYTIKNLSAWDAGVLKQSSDIKGEILQQGFFDLSGF